MKKNILAAILCCLAISFGGCKSMDKELKAIEGKDGVFLGFPSKQGKDGKYYSTIWISDEKERETVAELAVTEYNIITA